MSTGRLDIERIVAHRGLRRIGTRVELLDATPSTNDHVWRRAVEGVADGYVVFAEHQSVGRGRMGRSWHCPRGAGVMVSVLLRETANHPGPAAGMIALIAGVATARAVRQAAGVDARIEWPNDIVVGMRKLAGVLIESRLVQGQRPVYAIGIGINCLQHRDHFPPELRHRATSIELECPRAVSREAIAAELLSQLDAWLADPATWDARTICDAFRSCALPAGRRIRLRYQGADYEGEVIDIDPSAALVVMLDDGVRTVFPAVGTTVLRD